MGVHGTLNDVVVHGPLNMLAAVHVDTQVLAEWLCMCTALTNAVKHTPHIHHTSNTHMPNNTHT